MIIVSLIVFLTLVIIGHYFAWRLTLKLFPALNHYRFYLLGGFAAITAFFMLSFMFLHQSDSAILAGVYVFCAIFFGLLSQLMLLGAFHWLIFLVRPYLPLMLGSILIKKERLITNIFGGVVLGLFILGTVNAFYPQVKTITLTAWPEELKGKKIVHLSDLHLGAVYRPASLARVVEKVNQLDADIVIISGDLFDGSDEKLSEFIPVLKDFKATTIFVPGNHDYYVPEGEAEKTVLAGEIVTLNDRAGNFNGIEVVGLDYVGREHSNLRREIQGLSNDNALPRIVINHVPVDQAEAKALNAKLMLSGHTHRGQIFPFSFFLNLLYGRFSYGLENYEGMVTYTSAGTGTWGPPLRTLFPGEIIEFVIE